MTSISLPDNAGRVDTFTRVEGADTVHMQAVVAVDPASGDPVAFASDATLAAQSAILQSHAELLQAQQQTLAAIEGLTDTMVTLLAAMIKKMPRLTSGERLAAALVNASDYEPSSAYYPMNTGVVGNVNNGALYSRTLEPWNFSDAGCSRLYSQISVT